MKTNGNTDAEAAKNDIVAAADMVLEYVRGEMGSPSNEATARLLLITASALCRKQQAWETACAIAWKLTHPETVN